MSAYAMLKAAPYLAIAGLAIGLLWYRGEAVDAEAKRDLVQIELDSAKQSVLLAEKNNNETTRRFTAQQAIVADKEKELENANIDAATSRNAAAGLRKQLARLTAASRCAVDPNTTAGSTSTDATADLLDYVQQRLDDATNGIAEYADKARAAGRACERSYDALTPSH